MQPSQPANALAADPAVPVPRDEHEPTMPYRLAHAGLRALEELEARLEAAVISVDDQAMQQASALPGWRRAHLISHLARNADALVNLLGWARTGIERAAYASDEDRDADIAEGAERLPQVIREDYLAAAGRFRNAAMAMSEKAWSGTVTNRQGTELPGHLIPWMRITEVLVHLVDLDTGADFEAYSDLDPATLDQVIRYVSLSWRSIPEAPSVRIHVTYPDGSSGEHGIGAAGEETAETTEAEYEVLGTAPAVLAWLTGRGDGANLSGSVPRLPDWLQ